VLVVIGGGCFGRYHARQLLRAQRSGRLPRQPLVVVDRDPNCPAARELEGAPEVSLVCSDWSVFLGRWLAAASAADQLIPAPLAPHLLWEWLGSSLGMAPGEPPRGWGLPYEVRGPGRALYLSAAAWTCPATCIEPAHCPALHGPRDWDLAAIIEGRAAELGYEPALFRVRQLAGGIAGIGVGELQAARARLAAAVGRPALVATSSACHAAVGVLLPPAVG
jgi:hypothetical protein